MKSLLKFLIQLQLKLSFEGISSLHPKHLHFCPDYDLEDMPEAKKKQKRKHPSATGAEVLPQHLVGFRRSIKNHWLNSHPLEGSEEEWHSRPREAAYTSTPSITHRNSTNDLNATHNGAITPPGSQFYIGSVYSGNCSYNLPPRGKEQVTDTPIHRFLLTTVPVKLQKKSSIIHV